MIVICSRKLYGAMQAQSPPNTTLTMLGMAGDRHGRPSCWRSGLDSNAPSGLILAHGGEGST